MDAIIQATLPLFQILMIVASAYALLSCILLCLNSKHQRANHLLALWSAIWGLSCLFFYDYVQLRQILPTWSGNLFGPLIPISMFSPLYLYIKQLLYGSKGLERSDLLHLTPIFLYAMITVWLLLDSHWNSIEMSHHPMYRYRSITFSYIASAQGILYYVLNIQLLKKRERNLMLEFSDIEELKLHWVRLVNQFNLPIMLIGTVSTVIKSTTLNPMILYMSYHVLMAGCLIYITVKLITHPLFLTGRQLRWAEDTIYAMEASEDPIEPKMIVENKPEPQEEMTVYAPIIERLEHLMTKEKLYMDQDIDLQSLSRRLHITRNQLSYVLNHILHQTFYDYINGFRIEEAKTRMQNPKYIHYSISAIAIDSGFKSKAVFYRLFKASEGLLPTAYRDKLDIKP